MLIYRTYSCDGPHPTAAAEFDPDALAALNVAIAVEVDAAHNPHSFELLIERDEHPRFCPICGTRFLYPPETVPSGFAIGGSAAARAVDSTYALLEKSSAERAQLAEASGLSREQARSLKITDLNDTMREGDVAAKMPVLPNNEVGRFMRQASQVGINYGFQSGGAPGGGVYNGPTTNQAGAPVSGPANAALGAVQGEQGSAHERTKRQMAQNGEIWASMGNKRVR